MENVSNHTHCRNSSLARVVTSALRAAHVAVAIRLHSVKLKGLLAYFCPEHMCIL